MPFWRCFYHVIWATHHRMPLIHEPVEALIHRMVEHKAAELRTDILAMNGTQDHLHVAVAIPPSLAVAEWIRQVKGLTAYEINHHFTTQDQSFRWQKSYGVLTFGLKQQDIVVDYINHQKAHHQTNTVFPYLEETGTDSE